MPANSATVLARLRLPAQARLLPMYVHLEGEAALDGAGLVFGQDGRALFDSFFNAFPEGRFRELAELGALTLKLDLRGRFEVTLNRRGFGMEPRELARRECEGGCEVSIPPPVPGEEHGRICVSLACLGSHGSFLAGEFRDDKPLPPVSLVAAVCTYRREDSVAALAGRLAGDADLARIGFRLVVVDNGATLAPGDLPGENVTLITSANVGGSGGFATGLATALDMPGATHVLFMDDDIALDSEAVYRAGVLLARAKSDVALCGAMLDWELPSQIYESGALAFCGQDASGPHPWRVTPLRHRLDAGTPAALDGLCAPSRIDYGGFWFFALPLSVARATGLFYPFFLLGDDIEYGLRLSAMGVRLAESLGCGVWHLPFYGKADPAKHYLWTRNLLAVFALYRRVSGLRLAMVLIGAVYAELCKYRYDWALSLLEGVRDALSGPGVLTLRSQLELLAEVRARLLAVSENRSPVFSGDAAPDAARAQTPGGLGFLRGLGRALTLGGHLVPRRLLGREPAWLLARGRVGEWKKAFGRASQITFDMESGSAVRYQIRGLRGLSIFARLALAAASLAWRWPKASQAWRERAPYLTGREFWRDYLERGGAGRS